MLCEQNIYTLGVNFLLIILNTQYNWAQKLVDSPKADTDTLRYIHAIWRHGDRTPSVLIPSDVENNITTWKLGLGELTKLGMLQQYNLGKFLRSRYDGFLPSKYSSFVVYFRSSDYNRTIESAQCNAAGLFSTMKTEDRFLNDLRWRPVPVHTLPRYFDRILFDSVDCPMATEEEKRIFNNGEVRKIENENMEFLRLLAEKGGYDKKNFRLRDVWEVFDPLNSEFCHPDEHKLPDWVNKTTKDRIWDLYDLSSSFLYSSDKLIMLRGGPIFVEILNRMKNFAENRSDPREKLYAYSAHDTSVAGILSAFGVKLDRFPQYASMVLVELHQNVNKEYFVKLFYKNETDSLDLWEHQVPNCGSYCTLKNLEESRKNIIPWNWEEQCGLYRWYEFQPRTFFSMFGVLIVVCIVCLYKISILPIPFCKLLANNNKHPSMDDEAAEKFLNKQQTRDAMLITTAFSLFFLFWSSLFLIDFYLRSTQNEKYLAFVERRGFSVSPLQVRFYVSRTANINTNSSLLLMKSWTSTTSQRALRFILAWFSVGAFVGLICFIITPIYLTWILLIEVSNVVTLMRWRSVASFGGFRFASMLTTPLTIIEQEDVNFKTAISDLQTIENSLFYVPLQEHIQTGITPVIPGVNIPWSHLPLFMSVLVIAGVFHELGHAVAALNANVRLNGFGVFLFAVYPGAFTELETDELMRSSSAQKLRIFSAGIWHNIILALLGAIILWCAPLFFLPFYKSENGVLITDVNEKSGLYGSNGFQPGHIVTQINQCKVHNSTEWTQCLERMHIQQQNLHQQVGYLVQYSKVLPLTASPSNVIDTTQSGEVQCCSEFVNVTPSSHICFRYYPTLSQIFNPPNKGRIDLQKNNDDVVSVVDANKLEIEQKAAPKQAETTPAINFAGVLNIAKNRVKRADIIMPRNKILEANRAEEVQPTKNNEMNGQPQQNMLESAPKNLVAGAGRARHACLPARQITDHATCEQMDQQRNIKKVPEGYVCVVPALYNGTALLRFELLNGSRPVLFIGFLSEPLYMIDLMDITPRSTWIPYWIPLVVELFGKYLVTFSLAMALLNAMPCYGLDGQYMCQTVVDFFCFRKSPLERQKICNGIVITGTTIFCLNVSIGFVKFLLNYFK